MNEHSIEKLLTAIHSRGARYEDPATGNYLTKSGVGTEIVVTHVTNEVPQSENSQLKSIGGAVILPFRQR